VDYVRVIRNAHKEKIIELRSLPNSCFASASKLGKIKIWKNDGTFLRNLNRSHRDLLHLFHVDAELIMTWSLQNSVRLWNFEQGVFLKELNVDENDEIYDVDVLNKDHMVTLVHKDTRPDKGFHLKFFKNQKFKFCNSIPLNSIISTDFIQSVLVMSFDEKTCALFYDNKIKIFDFERS
jgi:WD40 repeat protein